MEQKKNEFELLAGKVTQWSGSSYAFGIATGLIKLEETVEAFLWNPISAAAR